MRLTRTALVAVSTLALATAATAVRAQDKLKPAERSVTISGCVVAAEQPDSYMLKDVKQLSGNWTAPRDPQGSSAFYWLNTTEGLKERVGQRVEVTGIVDFRDAHKGQTKVTVDPTEKKDTKTKATAEGREVTVKQDTPAVPKMDDAKKVEMKTPTAVYDLHVKTLKTVPGACAR